MKQTAFLLGVLALTACSGKPPSPQAPQPQARTATPWDQMQQAKQKAKDVQKASQEQADRQAKALDAAGQ
ncbi:hypothetical protein [Dyella sp.]|uniref:hypothetical protein n=1 Tax=Dyella sp. TaxID=1869338 RepID=UPI002ED2F0AC